MPKSPTIDDHFYKIKNSYSMGNRIAIPINQHTVREEYNNFNRIVTGCNTTNLIGVKNEHIYNSEIDKRNMKGK